jgi:hypothetical protein
MPGTPFASNLVPHRCNARRGRNSTPAPKRPSKPVYPTRAWKPEALLVEVRGIILERRARGWDSITAEGVAYLLRAKKGMVTACFQKLVHEGIMGHKFGVSRLSRDNCWWPSLYRIIQEKP